MVCSVYLAFQYQSVFELLGKTSLYGRSECVITAGKRERERDRDRDRERQREREIESGVIK